MGAAPKVVISKDWINEDSKVSHRTRKIHKFEQMRITRSEDLPELLTTAQAAKQLDQSSAKEPIVYPSEDTMRPRALFAFSSSLLIHQKISSKDFQL